MIAVGKAVPWAQRFLFNAIALIIKITGATGRLAEFIVALGTMVVLILSIRAIYDTARVFMGTVKYLAQEARYAINPWHKHSKTDLSGPDLNNPFRW